MATATIKTQKWDGRRVLAKIDGQLLKRIRQSAGYTRKEIIEKLSLTGRSSGARGKFSAAAKVARKQIRSKVKGLWANVGALGNARFARLWEYGGINRARPGKALSIPIHSAAYGKSPREFDDLQIIQRPGQSSIAVRKRMLGGAKHRREAFDLMFVFVREAKVAPHPYIRPGWDKAAPKVKQLVLAPMDVT